MKFKLYLTITTMLLLSNCSIFIRVNGDYNSTCVLHFERSVKLNIASNGQFEYKFAYNDEIIKGEWERVGDTLFLTSNRFFPSENFTPVTKNTNYSYKQDAYLIRNKKLYILDSLGVRKICYLKK